MSRGKGRQRWHCRACDKTSFGSKARAEEVMVGIQLAEDGTRPVPQRAYPCPYNNGWHLTKQASEVKR